MRRPTVLAGALLALALTGCSGEPRRSSVLLVVVDTLRQDHLGCYGYERDTSPHIDRLAAGAVRYAHAYAAASWTTPSVACLLTSRYPSELGILTEPNRLDDRFVLLSEVLSGEGYATAAVVSHYFLGSQWNFGQGFDSFDESSIRASHPTLPDGTSLGHSGVSSPSVTDSALAFLRQPRDRPFFLFVHYFDPHYDYLEHEGYRFSRPGYEGPVRSGTPYTDLISQLASLDDEDRRHLVDLYDSEVAFTDEHIGRLLDGLEELGLAEDTLVVLTADHGEELLDRGNIGHGHSLYEEQIAVPLIVRYPGGDPRVVEESVGLVDLFPTLLSYLGVPIAHRISGRSFLGTGDDPSAARRPVFSETDWGRSRSVVRRRLKLHLHLPSTQQRLFDLAVDPGERDDLLPRIAAGVPLGDGPDRPTRGDLQELQGRLEGWMETMERLRHEADSVDLTDEEKAQLRALGYLQD